MNPGDILQWTLAIIAVLTILINAFFGIKNSAVVTQLKENNTALKENNAAFQERNKQLEEENERLKQQAAETTAQHGKDIAALQGKVQTLERIKTPPLKPLMKLVNDQHIEVMNAIGVKSKIRIDRRSIKQ